MRGFLKHSFMWINSLSIIGVGFPIFLLFVTGCDHRCFHRKYFRSLLETSSFSRNIGTASSSTILSLFPDTAKELSVEALHVWLWDLICGNLCKRTLECHKQNISSQPLRPHQCFRLSRAETKPTQSYSPRFDGDDYRYWTFSWPPKCHRTLTHFGKNHARQSQTGPWIIDHFGLRITFFL